MRLARVILLHPFGLTPKRPELPCFLAPTVKVSIISLLLATNLFGSLTKRFANPAC